MNKLYKALVYDREVSLSVLETTDLVQQAIKIHNLSDTAAEILGGMLTACAYMAGCLKSEKGAVSLTVKSCDGSATVSVSGDINGHIRGYIDGAENGLKRRRIFPSFRLYVRIEVQRRFRKLNAVLPSKRADRNGCCDRRKRKGR